MMATSEAILTASELEVVEDRRGRLAICGTMVVGERSPNRAYLSKDLAETSWPV